MRLNTYIHSVEKWLAAVAATVIGGIAVWYFTDAGPPQPEQTRPPLQRPIKFFVHLFADDQEKNGTNVEVFVDSKYLGLLSINQNTSSAINFWRSG